MSAAVALGLAVFGGRREGKGVASKFFVGGMILLAAECALSGMGTIAVADKQRPYFWVEFTTWEEWRLLALSLLPGIWLCFSLTFARGNYRDFLKDWLAVLVLAFTVPPALAVFGTYTLFKAELAPEPNTWHFLLGPAGFALFLTFLVGSLLVLTNLEQTFRAAVGTMRWRIKFTLIGLGVLFSVHAYTASQAVLTRQIDPSLQTINCAGVLLGGLLMLRSFFRDASSVVIYPARRAAQLSLTMLVAGTYLFIVGVMAQVLKFLNRYSDFPHKAFIILLGVIAVSVLALSDRVRRYARLFMSRYLQRPLYDYRTVWRSFTQGTASTLTQDQLCDTAVKLAAEVFQVLSVTIWLVDDKRENLLFASSTSLSTAMAEKVRPSSEESVEVIQAFQAKVEPTEIEKSSEAWGEILRRCQPTEFQTGGSRFCVSLIAGGQLLGIMILGDRVGGAFFSTQDSDLLKCVADQVAAGLLNSQLSQKLLQAKELEAFQTMSAFFVHDLKNTANTLNLMIQNLPVHFDNPAFREDALRAITKSGQHINQLINRLSLLRHDLQIRPVESDLNEVVSRVLASWNGASSVHLIKELGTLPKVMLDKEQFQKVVTNLVLNASEALSKNGEIRVETAQNHNWASLTVSDNGCGMDPEFMRRSLFRPFQTTKKNGFGIGMFQSRMIVEAHGGRIDVKSEQGKGTTFRISLPLHKRQIRDMRALGFKGPSAACGPRTGMI
jgi:putative PEP-CTERM system histidine kinase